MKWRTINENVIESDAGYRVLQCTANDVPTGRYLAFAGRFNVVGGYDSSAEARNACEAHLYQTKQELLTA